MYREIHLGRNEVCRVCIQTHQQMGTPLSTPVSIWHVGDEFAGDCWKPMFVGKPARTIEILDGQDFNDARRNGERMFFNDGSAYWRYTREIVRRLYGTEREGWKRIAFTNIIKCGNSEREDRTTKAMKVNCIDTLGVIWREIKVLKPKSVVLYTHDLCDDEIDRFEYTKEYEDVFDRHWWTQVGAKKMLWWYREFRRDGATVLRLLRTSHPERKDKDEYLNFILDWIKLAPPHSTLPRS
jgi:hypothetical protein